MPQILLQFTLVFRGSARRPHEPRVQHLDIRRPARQIAGRHPAASLLVVDSRGMTPPCLSAAFAESARLCREPPRRHGVLVCNVPRLPLVVAAIRAGLRDVVHEPLDALRLARLLRAATPGGRVSSTQVGALAALLRGLAPTPRSPAARNLAKRDYELVRRAEQLDNRETRIELERAALAERERELRANSLRFERRFAALQNDADVSPPPPSPGDAAPFAAELDGIAARLRERALALDIRERMLTEMEHLLLGRLNGGAEHPLDIDTRPPFAQTSVG